MAWFGRSIFEHATLVGMAVWIGACQVEAPAAPELKTGPSIDAAGGFQIPETHMRGLQTLITRHTARALANPTVRARVYEALRDSPHKENKLHFRTLLEDVGRQLLAGIAADLQVPQSNVLAMLDSLVDLEFYMPVPAHWASWDGDANLIVASALRDHDVTAAFRLDGTAVTVDAAVPPRTPTLTIWTSPDLTYT